MPNTYIIDTAKYQPFSYDELIKPIERLEQRHKEYDDKYAEFSLENDKLGAQLDPNSESYKIYKETKDKINAAVESLASTGVQDPAAKKLYKDLRVLYSMNSADLNNRVNKFNTSQDAKTAALQSDASTIMSNNNPSMDDFAGSGVYAARINEDGTPIANNRMVSGAKLTEETMKYAQAALASLQDDPTFKTIKDKAKNEYYIEILNNGGVPLQSFNDFVSGKLNEDSTYKPLYDALQDIKGNMRNMVGYQEFDEKGKQQIDNALDNAAYAVLENKEYKTIGNTTALDIRAKEASIQATQAQKRAANAQAEAYEIANSRQYSPASNGEMIFYNDKTKKYYKGKSDEYGNLMPGTAKEISAAEAKKQYNTVVAKQTADDKAAKEKAEFLKATYKDGSQPLVYVRWSGDFRHEIDPNNTYTTNKDGKLVAGKGIKAAEGSGGPDSNHETYNDFYYGNHTYKWLEITDLNTKMQQALKTELKKHGIVGKENIKKRVMILRNHDNFTKNEYMVVDRAEFMKDNKRYEYLTNLSASTSTQKSTPSTSNNTTQPIILGEEEQTQDNNSTKYATLF